MLAPDLPGDGASAGPFSVERAVDQLADLISGTAGGHVCGISAGATVALRLALARPGQVSSLIRSGLQLNAPRLAAVVRNSLLAVVPAAAVSRPGRGVTKAAVRAVGRELDGTDLRPELANVTARTLVVCGAKDGAHLAASRQTASAITGAQLRIIDGAGHL